MNIVDYNTTKPNLTEPFGEICRPCQYWNLRVSEVWVSS